jgi:hypothetical protein
VLFSLWQQSVTGQVRSAQHWCHYLESSAQQVPLILRGLWCFYTARMYHILWAAPLVPYRATQMRQYSLKTFLTLVESAWAAVYPASISW